MDELRLVEETVTKDVFFFYIDKVKVKALWLIKLLDALEGTDGFFNGVKINGKILKKVLIKNQVISCSQSSCSPGKKFKTFRATVERMYYDRV